MHNVGMPALLETLPISHHYAQCFLMPIMPKTTYAGIIRTCLVSDAEQ